MLAGLDAGRMGMDDHRARACSGVTLPATGAFLWRLCSRARLTFSVCHLGQRLGQYLDQLASDLLGQRG